MFQVDSGHQGSFVRGLTALIHSVAKKDGTSGQRKDILREIKGNVFTNLNIHCTFITHSVVPRNSLIF